MGQRPYLAQHNGYQASPPKTVVIDYRRLRAVPEDVRALLAHAGAGIHADAEAVRKGLRCPDDAGR